ncbi:MAG: hypothetical protein PGN11_17655 [Quadrisphaera sp.]
MPVMGGALVRGGVEQLQLAAPGAVPHEQQQAAGVVGVQALQLGVVADRQRPRLALEAVRAERQGR